jgi:hypothetical protein
MGQSLHDRVFKAPERRISDIYAIEVGFKYWL